MDKNNALWKRNSSEFTSTHLFTRFTAFQTFTMAQHIYWRAVWHKFVKISLLSSFLFYILLSLLRCLDSRKRPSVCLLQRADVSHPSLFFFLCGVPSSAAGVLLISAMYWQSHTLLVPVSLAQGQLPSSASWWWLTKACWFWDIMRSDRMQMCTSRRAESAELEVQSGMLSHYIGNTQ